MDVEDLVKFSFHVEIQVRYPVESQSGESILAGASFLAYTHRQSC
jgi:hypothetical protein